MKNFSNYDLDEKLQSELYECYFRLPIKLKKVIIISYACTHTHTHTHTFITKEKSNKQTSNFLPQYV